MVMAVSRPSPVHQELATISSLGLEEENKDLWETIVISKIAARRLIHQKREIGMSFLG
jgi:hypothetical protein